MRFSILPFFLAFILSCSEPTSIEKKAPHLAYGDWLLQMQLDSSTTITQPVSVDSSYAFTFLNGAEAITTHPAIFGRDSFFLDMPIYHSYFVDRDPQKDLLEGFWHYPDRDPSYKIPFTASYLGQDAHDTLSLPADTLRYRIHFSPDSPDAYPAIGEFMVHDRVATGTFLTETGDYRFLHGTFENDNLVLQCFDGSHAFHFDMKVHGDSLTGVFRSGVHWKESFTGVLDNAASLRDPYEITRVVNDQPIQFTATSLTGEKVRFNRSTFTGGITLIQLFGSWCPNCLDESRFYTELHDRYAEEGLTIVPIAFERSRNFAENVIRLKRYGRELHLPFDIYIGGRASKAEASDMFPMLNAVTSFPTSLFVDRNGKIAAIHTGFNGPGTGDVFTAYKQETFALLDSLLATPKP